MRAGESGPPTVAPVSIATGGAFFCLAAKRLPATLVSSCTWLGSGSVVSGKGQDQGQWSVVRVSGQGQGELVSSRTVGARARAFRRGVVGVPGSEVGAAEAGREGVLVPGFSGEPGRSAEPGRELCVELCAASSAALAGSSAWLG